MKSVFILFQMDNNIFDEDDLGRDVRRRHIAAQRRDITLPPSRASAAATTDPDEVREDYRFVNINAHQINKLI